MCWCCAGRTPCRWRSASRRRRVRASRARIGSISSSGSSRRRRTARCSTSPAHRCPIPNRLRRRPPRRSRAPQSGPMRFAPPPAAGQVEHMVEHFEIAQAEVGRDGRDTPPRTRTETWWSRDRYRRVTTDADTGRVIDEWVDAGGEDTRLPEPDGHDLGRARRGGEAVRAPRAGDRARQAGAQRSQGRQARDRRPRPRGRHHDPAADRDAAAMSRPTASRSSSTRPPTSRSTRAPPAAPRPRQR